VLSGFVEDGWRCVGKTKVVFIGQTRMISESMLCILAVSPNIY